MIIELKGIQNKENNWQPEENYYFSEEEVKEIIKEEKLNENMICMQNIGFNTDSQTFTNIVFDCDKYNNESIFLIKSKNVIKGKEYHFAYVTYKNWNTARKVVLELKIDILTSNYEWFKLNKFKGQVYTERTNNYQRSINNYHPDICSGIENHKVIYKDTNLVVNKKIDTFINSKLFNYTKEIWTKGAPLAWNTIKMENKGTIFTTAENTNQFISYNSLAHKLTKIHDTNLPPIIDDILSKYSNSKWSDNQLNFDNTQKAIDFLNELQASYGLKNTMLNDVDKTIKDINVNKWLSLPRFFEINDESIISNFEIDLSKYINIDLKNHMDLHNEYHFVCGKLFSIPIDLLRLNLDNKKIYGSRIINIDTVIYNFYYSPEKTENFYTINISLSNGQLNQEYEKYLNDLNISYNSGMKGISPMVGDIGQNAILAFLSKGLKIGGEGLSGMFSGLGFMNLLKIPFDLYKESKNTKYQQQAILNKPKEASNVLLIDALYKVLLNETFSANWTYYSIDNTPWIGYMVTTKDKIKNPKIENYLIEIKSPIEDDIQKIETDQKLYGNIVNQTFESLDNPLVWNELTQDHLYWKGKILPDVNPLDTFQMDMLNEVLAKGVYINKKRIINK